MRSASAQSGFTLIELMNVVAIIGVLAVIATTTYQSYIKESYEKSCLIEAKSYTNEVYYALTDEDSATLPIAPSTSACQAMTDATNWTLGTQQKIVATAKPPSNARIECDIPNGAPCRILP